MITVTIIKDNDEGQPVKVTSPAEAIVIMRKLASVDKRLIKSSVYHSIEFNDRKKR